jgi:hypothetical protein
MKQLVRKLLNEQDEVINVPDLDFFDGSWEELLEFTRGRKFRVRGDLDLTDICPETLGNIISVDGDLDLYDCENLTSLGSLERVDGYLDLWNCENLTSLGNLKYVGGYLRLSGVIAEKYSEEEIRKMVDVKGNIYK